MELFKFEFIIVPYGPGEIAQRLCALVTLEFEKPADICTIELAAAARDLVLDFFFFRLLFDFKNRVFDFVKCLHIFHVNPSSSSCSLPVT